MKVAIVYNRESTKVINVLGVVNQERYGKEAIARVQHALEQGGHHAAPLGGRSQPLEGRQVVQHLLGRQAGVQAEVLGQVAQHAPHALERADLVLGCEDLLAEAGQLDPGESRIIRNLLFLDSLAARDIMTPRPVITGLPERSTVAEAMELMMVVSEIGEQ